MPELGTGSPPPRPELGSTPAVTWCGCRTSRERFCRFQVCLPHMSAEVTSAPGARHPGGSVARVASIFARDGELQERLHEEKVSMHIETYCIDVPLVHHDQPRRRPGAPPPATGARQERHSPAPAGLQHAWRGVRRHWWVLGAAASSFAPQRSVPGVHLTWHKKERPPRAHALPPAQALPRFTFLAPPSRMARLRTPTSSSAPFR